jgi:single-stranded-DNA-specific exonuclease
MANNSLQIESILFQRLGLTDARSQTSFLACTPTYPTYLSPTAYTAAEYLLSLRGQNKTIGIYGDSDVDGLSSTIIAETLCQLLQLSYIIHIPDRSTDGYGLTVAGVKRFQHVDCILTVDNGISAQEAISYAKQMGKYVVVTDHHTVPAVLPSADIIVNRKLTDCPFTDVCGAKTILEVMMAVQQLNPSLITPQAVFDCGLIAAVATVADVMPLLEENRQIVKWSLDAFSNGSRPFGLAALFDNKKIINCKDIGWTVAPLLNAAMRVNGNMRIAYNALKSGDIHAIKQLEEYKALANSRTDNVCQQLQEQVEEQRNDFVFILVKQPDDADSAIGIAANRIMGTYQKPTVILIDNNGELSGTARSPIAIRPILTATNYIWAQGHDKACAVKIPHGHPEYKRDVELLFEQLAVKDELPIQAIDIELSDVQHIQSVLRKFEPFGQGNPQPIFRTVCTLTEIKTMGNGKHLDFRFANDVKQIRGVQWNTGRQMSNYQINEQHEVIYKLAHNTFNYQTELEVESLERV